MSDNLTLGIHLSDDFPKDSYDHIHHLVNAYYTAKGKELKGQISAFGMGWNAVVYRYRGMTDNNIEYSTRMRKSGAHSHEDLYLQDQAMFSFFTNGLSVLECLFFSIYCLGAVASNGAIIISESRDLQVYPHNVVAEFVKVFSKESLLTKMKATLAEREYGRLCGYRNVLSHRGYLTRKIFIGGADDGKITMPSNPKDIPTQWQLDCQLDENTTSDYRQWIVLKINELIIELEAFCEKYFEVA